MRFAFATALLGLACSRETREHREPPAPPPPPPATRTAFDCRQTDGHDTTFHREFLLDVAGRRAWGDQSINGVFAFDLRSPTAPGHLRGDSRATCPPNDPESCRVHRVVTYDFDLGSHTMEQTLWNDVGLNGRADGKVVETLHFACTELPLDRSVVAAKQAD